MPTDPLAQVVVVREAAQLLHVSERRIYQLIEERKIRVRRAAGIWLISRESVELLRLKPGPKS